MTTLLGISGSLRKDSRNTALINEAARLFAPVEFILADIRFPLYDGDLEDSDGLPEATKVLIEQIVAADAVIISTPEYNSNISGVLKNALDWVSRSYPFPWVGKPVAIMSAAARRAGGARAQFSLRNCMTPFNPRILQGPEVMVAAAGKAFDDDGRLTGDYNINSLTKLMESLRTETER